MEKSESKPLYSMKYRWEQLSATIALSSELKCDCVEQFIRYDLYCFTRLREKNTKLRNNKNNTINIMTTNA
jgi:hypothetical protein